MPSCKQPDPDTTAQTLHEVIKPWRLTGEMRAYKPVGYLECRMTGYRGRAGLYETAERDRSGARRDHPLPDISKLRSLALADGLRPLRMAGAIKVAEGLTTIEEVLRATPAWDG